MMILGDARFQAAVKRMDDKQIRVLKVTWAAERDMRLLQPRTTNVDVFAQAYDDACRRIP